MVGIPRPVVRRAHSEPRYVGSQVLLIYEVLLASDEGSTAECEFCAPKKVFVRKRDTLLDLKHAIHKALGGHMTPDKQRVILAASCWTTVLLALSIGTAPNLRYMPFGVVDDLCRRTSASPPTPLSYLRCIYSTRTRFTSSTARTLPHPRRR
jgi:hypothetical protein